MVPSSICSHFFEIGKKIWKKSTSSLWYPSYSGYLYFAIAPNIFSPSYIPYIRFKYIFFFSTLKVWFVYFLLVWKQRHIFCVSQVEWIGSVYQKPSVQICEYMDGYRYIYIYIHLTWKNNIQNGNAILYEQENIILCIDIYT